MWIQGRGHSIRRGKGITDNSPFVIGIGGSQSGAGKTTVATALLKHFSSKEKNFCASAFRNFSSHAPSEHGWGAIKYTKTAIYSSIVDDPSLLRQANKDTARLLDAGAENVLWVQCPHEGLKEVMHIAVSRLSYLRGIIIEGNSAIEFLKPDVVVFIFGRDTKNLKKSAIKVLDVADIVLFREKPSIKLPERAKKFRVALFSMSGLDECINYINRLLR